MNRTKLLPIVLSIALVASVGGNFYSYSQSKALSNALYDSTKQVETLTQELEQSQLALEAAVISEVVVPGYTNSFEDMTLEEMLAYAEKLKQEIDSPKALPGGATRYAWDDGSLGSEYYTVYEGTPKSVAQYHQEYRQKFNIPDSTKLDPTLSIFNDKDGDGIKNHIEEGRVFDAARDADPESSLAKNAVAADIRAAEMEKAIAEGKFDEYLAKQRKDIYGGK